VFLSKVYCGFNDAFQTVPAAVSIVRCGFEESLSEMTKYRRRIVPKNKADSFLPVILNDYMNYLIIPIILMQTQGTPSLEKHTKVIQTIRYGHVDRHGNIWFYTELHTYKRSKVSERKSSL